MLAAFGDELDKLGGAPVAVRDLQRRFAHPIPYEVTSPPSKKLLAAVGSGTAVLGYGIGRAHSAYKRRKEEEAEATAEKAAQMYPADMAKGTKAKPKETPRPGGQGLPRLGSGKPEGGGSATPFSGNKMKMASHDLDTLIGAGALTGTALAVRKAYQRAEDEVHETARRKSLPLHVARGAGSALRSRLG